MSSKMNLESFLAIYDPDSTRVVADITPERDADGNSQFVIVRHGRYTVVLALMPFGEQGDHHLCIDVHPFKDGEPVTAGVFGMSEGHRFTDLTETGTTSHGFPSAQLIAVLTGKQG